MLAVRKSNERGHAQHGWLDSYHSFSFADYYDPEHMGFSVLRVINEDRVAAGAGFPTHGHRDMEIISYVLDGALEHKDSLGTGSIIRAGEVQRMSAGSGVSHSEFNPSADTPAHFLQIWIEPARRGITPSYEQKPIADAEKRGRLRLIASPDGREGSVTINQDTNVYATLLEKGMTLTTPLRAGRKTYIHIARGALIVNGVSLTAGDALKVDDEAVLTLVTDAGGEALIFDLP